METRAHSLRVGIFVLATLALGIVLAIWLARAGNSGPKKEFYIVFNGSVQGLDKDSYVLFNGLRVGVVNEIGLNPGNTSEVRAHIVVDAMTPVKRDSAVRLTYAGLTGVASIEVTGGRPGSEDLIPGKDGMPPTLYAERSFVQNLMESGSETLGHINEVVSKLNRLVDENSDNITAAIKNIRDLTEEARAKGLVANVSRAADNIAHMSENVDRRITIISGDISRFTNKGLKELEGLISDGRKTLSSVDEAVRELNRNPQGLIFGRPAVPTYKGQ